MKLKRRGEIVDIRELNLELVRAFKSNEEGQEYVLDKDNVSCNYSPKRVEDSQLPSNVAMFASLVVVDGGCVGQISYRNTFDTPTSISAERVKLVGAPPLDALTFNRSPSR